MSKIERMQEFQEWLTNKVQTIHILTAIEFENIYDKI